MWLKEIESILSVCMCIIRLMLLVLMMLIIYFVNLILLLLVVIFRYLIKFFFEFWGVEILSRDEFMLFIFFFSYGGYGIGLSKGCFM